MTTHYGVYEDLTCFRSVFGATRLVGSEPRTLSVRPSGRTYLGEAGQETRQKNAPFKSIEDLREARATLNAAASIVITGLRPEMPSGVRVDRVPAVRSLSPARCAPRSLASASGPIRLPCADAGGAALRA